MAVNDLIQFRKGLAATWTSVNPVLAAGEPGYETDTGKFKIGDNTTAWNALPYQGTSSGGTGTVTSVATGTGLTGGPVTTSGTIAIDTAVVPSLGTANAFTGDQTVNGNIIVTLDAKVGNGAATQTQVTTNPIIVAKDTGATYVQTAMINSNSTGSADFAAYADNGTDASGWVDMGFTGSAFNDTNYTITNPNDGYLFASAGTATATGNLVLATSGNGSANDIVFATGGFLTANEKARMSGSTGKLTVKALATQAGTTTLAPIQLTSGTNLTTATAGALEYDGKVPYFTHESTNRGVIAAEQFQILTTGYTTAAGTASTLKQTFNATTNGAVTVAGNTTYDFEMMINLTGLSATSGSFGFGFLGTATYSRVQYLAIANKTATSVQTASSHTLGTSNAYTIISAANTTTTGYAYIKGILVIGAGGTIIPATGASVAAAYVVAAGSYFRLRPIGSNTVTTVGNWS